MKKGELLYETPPVKASHKTLAIIVYGVYATLVIALTLSGAIWRESILDTVALIVFVLPLLFLLSSMIALRLIDISFAIYEEGLTEPLSGITRAFRKERNYMPYHAVEAFEVYASGRRALLHCTSGKRLHYGSHRSSVIGVLRKHLVQHGVREVQDTCQSCGKRVYGRVCANCGTKRF